MQDKFIRHGFENVIQIQKLITIFYMEFSKDFHYEGERHDFWEMVYIDKGEMICTADKKQFVLKGGELTFHKPNEFHNLSGNQTTAPNVSIITFECKSKAMKNFEGKIFKLNAEEKALLSLLFSEGLSAFQLKDKYNPLLQSLEKIENAPFGSSQSTKNLLEIFLIRLFRNQDVLPKQTRFHYKVNGVDIPYEVKEILDVLEQNIHGKITVADVAKALGKSESTIKNLFSSYPHSKGIIHYYNQLKIEEAKALIREGKYNFTQIAELLHFDTPQYFSSCFKRFTKMSPLEYKKSIVK